MRDKRLYRTILAHSEALNRKLSGLASQSALKHEAPKLMESNDDLAYVQDPLKFLYRRGGM